MKLRDVASLYERDKRLWIFAMNELERKITVKYIFLDAKFKRFFCRPV